MGFPENAFAAGDDRKVPGNPKPNRPRDRFRRPKRGGGLAAGVERRDKAFRFEFV
jgi:hypothetical protein